MSFVFLVILAGVLIAVYLKKPRRGMVTGLYMTIYAMWRFAIEFFRADYRGNVGPLSTSQFISLFILAFGVYLLVKSRLAVNDFEATAEPAPAPEPEPEKTERPETAPLPVDPLEQVKKEERADEPLPVQPETATLSDEPVAEVAEATELTAGAAEVAGEVGGAAEAGDAGGDGGDQ